MDPLFSGLFPQNAPKIVKEKPKVFILDVIFDAFGLLFLKPENLVSTAPAWSDCMCALPG